MLTAYYHHYLKPRRMHYFIIASNDNFWRIKNTAQYPKQITDLCRHLTLLLSVFRYGLSYIFFNYYSRWAKISYRLAFISAAATYGIVVYKQYIARGKLSGSPLQIAVKLLSDENVQYLGRPSPVLRDRQ
jgi:hypothetical protein